MKGWVKVKGKWNNQMQDSRQTSLTIWAKAIVESLKVVGIGFVKIYNIHVIQSRSIK